MGDLRTVGHEVERGGGKIAGDAEGGHVPRTIKADGVRRRDIETSGRLRFKYVQVFPGIELRQRAARIGRGPCERAGIACRL